MFKLNYFSGLCRLCRQSRPEKSFSSNLLSGSFYKAALTLSIYPCFLLRSSKNRALDISIRPYTATPNHLEHKLNSYYITGFADGESSFIVSVNPNSGIKTGYRVKATFSIGLHKKDLHLLRLIQKFFGL
jgi:hypothetical protein